MKRIGRLTAGIVRETRRKMECREVAIEVSDNGTGIDPAYIDRVFNEHFTTKGPNRGSGLGLAVCRSLIRDAGGDIAIASTQGEGTTVTVTLPVPDLGSTTAAGLVKGK